MARGSFRTALDFTLSGKLNSLVMVSPLSHSRVPLLTFALRSQGATPMNSNPRDSLCSCSVACLCAIADYVLGSMVSQQSPGVALRESKIINERGFAPRSRIRGQLCDGAVGRGELLRWLNWSAGDDIWLGRGIEACRRAPRVAWALG